jgi:hypothetical protein
MTSFVAALAANPALQPVDFKAIGWANAPFV